MRIQTSGANDPVLYPDVDTAIVALVSGMNTMGICSRGRNQAVFPDPNTEIASTLMISQNTVGVIARSREGATSDIDVGVAGVCVIAINAVGVIARSREGAPRTLMLASPVFV